MELGLFLIRLAIGGTVTAHGLQKLLDPERGGHGIDATAGFLDRLGFQPARAHAWLLAVAELAGGLGLAVGLLTPVATAAVIGVMVAAITAVHLDHGFFAQDGGIEFPMVLGLGTAAVAIAGPGDWSVDHALGDPLTGAGWAAAAVLLGVGAGLLTVAARRISALGTTGRGSRPAHT
jgi:putative oxidoreductase